MVISVRVQGVWVRGWAVETARELGLGGWVRNRRDGSVEAVLVGPERQVAARRCHAGPPAARVDDVRAEALDLPDPPPLGFQQRPSA